ncbi:MAG: hypothetical protein OJJ54_20155 [Pseudonocardia sp.]|nr:hypothetical protein [Pseudonocardia sp.]
MLFLIAFAGAAIIALLLWRAMQTDRAEVPGGSAQQSATAPRRPRATGPDDDPEFLRRLDEAITRPEDPPST